MAELELVLNDLDFGEGPRWHDGRLWYSDFYQHRVYAVSPDGSTCDRPRAGAVLVIHYFGWTNPLADELAADPEGVFA